LEYAETLDTPSDKAKTDVSRKMSRTHRERMELSLAAADLPRWNVVRIAAQTGWR
jgi:hypothetical protein